METMSRVGAWPIGESEMAQRIRAHDWSATPFGPVNAWPDRLRHAIELVLDMPFPAAVGWGPDLLQIYNDRAIDSYGHRHPAALGRPLLENFVESATRLRAARDRMFATGEAFDYDDEAMLLPSGDGGSRQRRFTGGWTPIRGDSGDILGVIASGMDTTDRVRSEAAVRNSEQLLRALNKASSYLSYRMSADWAEMHEFEDGSAAAPDVGSGRAWLIEYILPADQDLVNTAIDEAIRNKSVFELEHRIRRPDGSIGWALSRAVPILGADGEIVEWFGAGSDVTDRRQQQERQTFLLRLSDELRSVSEPRRIQEEAARLLGEHLQSSTVCYDELDATTGRYIVGGEWHHPDEPGSSTHCLLEEWTIPGLTAGRTWAVADTSIDPAVPDEHRSGRRGDAISALIAAPLVKEGRLAAVLLVTQKARRKWTAGEIGLVEETAERTWAAVERARSEAALRESEATLAGVIEQVPMGVALFDEHGRIKLKNPHLQHLIGDFIPSQDEAGGHHWQGVDAAGRPIALQEYPGVRALRGEDASLPTDFKRVSDGDERWLRVSAVPVKNGAAIIGGITIVQDVTAERRVQAEILALGERNREILESISDAFYAVDSDLCFTYVNRRAEEVWGKKREELLGSRFLDVFPAALGSEAYEAHLQAISAREVVRLETVSLILRHWIDVSIYPTADGGLSVYFRDISEKKQGELARRESEERYRMILDSARDYAIFATDLDGCIQTWPAGAEAVFGWTAEEAIGQDSAITFVPEDVAKGQPGRELSEAMENGVAPNVRWHRRKDGGRVFIEGSTRLLRQENGAPYGFLKIGQDTTNRHEWEETQKVLVAELQHRTRNLIAVVRSIATQTMAHTGPTEAFRTEFSDRLSALSRVQGLLSQAQDERITIGGLVKMELDALGAVASERLVMSGPAVPLRHSVVQTLALALHELATNARKYGALSAPDGSLRITWTTSSVEGEGRRLLLEWLEEGLTLAAPSGGSERKGFGRELIEHALPYSLRAKTSFELGDGRLRCTIDLPLAKRKGSGG
ncbi:PAS domain S-box protein [Rhizobium sp. SAFR-030]|uniref:PAS domain S-box protein n=1 Tax=Rhizobium sp. SAFR-030 TaxID=3387277 RepID=UPI003F802493